MNDYVLYFILASIFAFGTVLIALYTKTAWSYLSIILWTTSSLFTSLSASYLRGEPKIISTETRNVEAAEVLWVRIVPKKAVYLILNWKGLDNPLYYDMAWTPELEKQLTQAQAKATSRNMPLMMRNPFSSKNKNSDFGDGQNGNGKTKGNGSGSSTEGGGEEETFYPEPPKPIPPKSEEDAGI